MIPPDSATELHAGRPFEIVAAVLIGTIAVLASLLAVIEVGTGQRSTRAQLEAARLTADVSAALQVSSMVSQAVGSQQQAAMALSFEGASRALAGIEQGDEAEQLIGAAEVEAGDRLIEALTASAATASGPPLDAYTARLVDATIDELNAEVAEQNAQVDLADDAGARNTWAILGLSFLALAGVLTGLGAALREGRAGWYSLIAAGAMVTAAGVMAMLSVT